MQRLLSIIKFPLHIKTPFSIRTTTRIIKELQASYDFLEQRRENELLRQRTEIQELKINEEKSLPLFHAHHFGTSIFGFPCGNQSL